MRWPVFFVFAAVCVVLEVSVRNSLALRSLGNIAPSFAAVLVVYVALFASRRIQPSGRPRPSICPRPRFRISLRR